MAWMGINFYDFHGFQSKRGPAYTYAIQYTHFIKALTCLNKGGKKKVKVQWRNRTQGASPMMMMSLRAPAAARWSKQRSVTAVWELKRRLPWHCRRRYAAMPRRRGSACQSVCDGQPHHPLHITAKKKKRLAPAPFFFHTLQME